MTPEKYKHLLTTSERPSHGEVGTPVALVNEMLDKIPEEIFRSSITTFLDPCFGSGTFIDAIIKKLRQYGHSMENIQERIYGCEVSHRLHNKFTKELSINYNFTKLYKEDFLTKDFNNMKFDVVIGNPPFNENSSDSTNTVELYSKFTYKAIELSKGKVSFVIPFEWAKRNSSKIKKKLFGSGMLESLNIHNDKVFKGVSKITCDFILDVNSRDTKVLLSTNTGLKNCLSIVEDTMLFNNLEIADKPVNSLAELWLRGKESISDLKDTGKYKVLYSLNGRKDMKFKYSDTETTGLGKWKAVVGNLGGINNIGAVKVIGPDIAHNYSVVSFPFDTQQEAEKLKDYLQSEEVINKVKMLKGSTPNSKSLFTYIRDISI